VNPTWQPPARATRVNVKAHKAKPKTPKGWRRHVILPDPQIGFRRDIETLKLEAFHDEAAMSAALRVLRHVGLGPGDSVVNLGDYLDFPRFGRFAQEPGFALVTQPALDRGYTFLAEQCAAAPDAEHFLIEGNHDARLGNYILANAAAAHGLRKAELADERPLLTLPNLLRLEELGVEYVEGYPNGEVWLTDDLVCVHGSKVRSNGSTAAAYVKDESVSVIFGHIHRVEYQSRRSRRRRGTSETFAASPGTLARIDGSVPSQGSSVDLGGNRVPRTENWSQGMAIVHVPPSGRAIYEQVHIVDGDAFYGGRTI
jgi:predicted phosphodiesterase